MDSYENKIIDAIELVADKKISELDFNKTVQATIIRAINKALGKYYVKYQDASFEASSTNLNVEYAEGASVYVMIPGNDTAQDKIIIGAVDKTEISQNIDTIMKDDRYENIGVNCAGTLNTFELCSYTPYGDIKTLYDKKNNINLIGLNEMDAAEYITNSSVISLGADFRTELPSKQQYKGNYGIIFELIFKDSLERFVTKTYTVDINSMIGNPYKLNEFTTQNQYFSIDGEFQYINKIYIFEKDFLYEEENKPNDIFIKNIKIQAVLGLTEEELNGSRIMLSTPNGNYFKLEDEDNSKKKIVAKLKIKNKETEVKQNYYWFKENNNITPSSENFSYLGGAGWELVATTIKNEYEVIKTSVTSKEQKYKCVIEINESRLSATTTIRNYSSDYEITLQSDLGTVFLYEISNPILTCYVNGEQDDKFEYSWVKIDENGYEQLSSKINKYSPEINKIENSATFKCTVSYNGKYIGTAALTLFSRIDSGSGFSVRIINGNRIYTYNANGLAPTHESLEKPIKIEPLKCVLYDNLGNAVADDILNLCNITWEYPQEKTLIKVINTENNLLYYTLEDNYNQDYNNNDIKVRVSFKDLILSTKITINFNKQGDEGTSGSNISCKIVPNTNAEIAYPQIQNGKLNYIPIENGKWFKVKLYEDGKEILNGFNVEWGLYQNQYDKETYDYSDIIIDPDQKFSARTMIETVGANVVKAKITYKGKDYYASMPIVTSQCSLGYSIAFEGGFTQVQYSSNGINPKYIDKPFEIIFRKNGLDISTDLELKYQWKVLGRIYDFKTDTWEEKPPIMENELITKLPKNKKSFIPNDYFNGEYVNCAVEVNVLNGNNIIIGTMRIPVYMFLNRFENANIEGWDGNSIKISNEGGYILTPQIGSGRKESDGSFTGMIMGEAKEPGSEESKLGLLGYSNGEQSLFLDSRTGAAVFGKSSGGKLSIDPDAEHAYLYSNNYWKNYKDNGLPNNYNDANLGKEGMLIDLDTPEINFGNGNFRINKKGDVYYKNGLTSEGVFSKVTFLIHGYGWQEGGANNFFEVASRIPYGKIGHMSCVNNYSWDANSIMKVDSIKYKNFTFPNPIETPSNFKINNIYLKLECVQQSQYIRDDFYSEDFLFFDNGADIDKVNYAIPSWMEKRSSQPYGDDYTRTTYYVIPKEKIKIGIFFVPFGEDIMATSVLKDIREYVANAEEWAENVILTPTEYSQLGYITWYNQGADRDVSNFDTSRYLIKTIDVSFGTEKKAIINLDLTNELKSSLNNGGILYFISLEPYPVVNIPNQSLVTGTDGNKHYKSSSVNALEKVGEGYRDVVCIKGSLDVNGYLNIN